jgi:hypothetical protein
MTERGVALCLAAMVGACGGKEQVGVIEPILPMAGIGDCVDAAPPSTKAAFMQYSADDNGVQICRGDLEECRMVDLASGEMREYLQQMRAGEYDQPFVSVEDDRQLLVCWGGPASCLRRAPSAYETWMAGQVADGRVAVLSSETDRRFVTLMDGKLTTTARFEVAPTATDVVWHGGQFLVHAAGDDGAVHGYLYDSGGKPRGVVGALAAGKAFDIGSATPVDAAPGVWAFIERDGTALAVHDLAKGDGVRVELGTAQDRDTASLGVAAGEVVVALGGAAYGDLLVVDVDARVVRRLTAQRCEARP